MITLIRPKTSKLADEIEKRLREARAVYSTIHKQVSDITYLVESGQVFQGEAILRFIEEQLYKTRRSANLSSDDKFFSR
jgi:hypothetical protein